MFARVSAPPGVGDVERSGPNCVELCHQSAQRFVHRIVAVGCEPKVRGAFPTVASKYRFDVRGILNQMYNAVAAAHILLNDKGQVPVHCPRS